MFSLRIPLIACLGLAASVCIAEPLAGPAVAGGADDAMRWARGDLAQAFSDGENESVYERVKPATLAVLPPPSPVPVPTHAIVPAAEPVVVSPAAVREPKLVAAPVLLAAAPVVQDDEARYQAEANLRLPQAPEDSPYAETQANARGGLLAPAEGPLLTSHPFRSLGLGLGAVLLSSSLDKSGERFGRSHGERGAAGGLAKVGNVLPILALGAAAIASLDSSDMRLQRTGVASLQAGGGAVLTSLGLKYVIGRPRPETGASPTDFSPGRSSRANSSMPSIHTAAMWGAVTPFAREYDMPWLYGVAALTNYARVAQRKHWVSDTIAGSVIGYLAGDLAWQWNRPRGDYASQVYISGNGFGISWPLQ